MRGPARNDSGSMHASVERESAVSSIARCSVARAPQFNGAYKLRLTYSSANFGLPDSPALSAFSSLELHRQALESLADMRIY
jgi:hypothetical protein